MNVAPGLGTTSAPGAFLAPYVPSPEVLVDRMLDVAGVGPGDTVYDLGAGDGRIVVAAAQRFGARAVGVELDDQRFMLSSARIRDLGLEARARMVHGDLLDTDLRPATVVTLYQLPAVNEMLRPTLERQLLLDARVVTLDFPVSGWEATRTLTGRLSDGSQHAIYLYSMGQIRKESAIMATSEGPYGRTNYVLELQGTTAGFVRSVEGGDATAEVVVEKLGQDLFPHKHIGVPKYEDITVSFGTGMSNSVYDWIDATVRRVYPRLDGAVVMSAYDKKQVSRLNFFNALISEIGFPALDTSAKDAGYITLKVTPEYTTRVMDNRSTLPSAAGQKGMLVRSNFRLQIDGLDCSRVSQIDALTITQRMASSEIGEQLRDVQADSPTLDIPNLAITVEEDRTDTFRQWHEEFLIKGNNGDDKEKGGTLEFHGANVKDVLFTLTFRNLGIFRLTPEKVDAGNSNVARLRAEMYCEDMVFQYGASAGSVKGAGAGTATGQSSGTPGGGVYAQSFRSDAALRGQVPVVAQDLAAAPLRLGRPLRFRS